jgi:predicted  nucleic acid-binding Zn-ribbon protein
MKPTIKQLQETIKKLRARIKVLNKALVASEKDYESIKRKNNE